MANEKLTKIKRQIARLEYSDICELYKWLIKKKEDAWKKERIKRKQEYDEKIKALSPGTEVVATEMADDLAGLIGKVVYHLGRGSPRTLVDFGEKGKWNVPRRMLSDNITEEHIKQIKRHNQINVNFNRVFSRVFK